MVQFLEGRNRAWAQLDAPINGSDTNVALVAWQGSRLSDVTTASGRKVRAQIYERDAETGAITKCELVNITNNVSDVLIIERTVESTRATDTTNTYAADPQSFTANAIIEEVISSEVISEIQDEVNRIVDEELPLKADQADVDALNNVYAAASGGTDNYAFTIPWFVSYAANAGKHYTFLSDVANAGASWVNISGLGNIPMYKQHDQNTETGDIEASQLVEIVIGPGGTYVEMVSQVAKVVDLSSYDVKWGTITAWENLFTGDVLYPTGNDIMERVRPTDFASNTATFTEATGGTISKVLKIDATRQLHMNGWYMGTALWFSAKIGTINAGETDCTYWSAYTAGGINIQTFDVCQIDTYKFLVIFKDHAAGYKAVILDVWSSGNTITNGSIVAIEASGNGAQVACANLDTSRTAILYTRDSDTKLYVQILSTSGNTITTNTAVVFDNTNTSGGTGRRCVMSKIDTNKLLAVYCADSSDPLVAKTIDVSGTVPTVNGSNTLSATSDQYKVWNMAVLSATKVALFYADDTILNDDTYIAILTISGSTVTKWTNLTLTTSSSGIAASYWNVIAISPSVLLTTTKESATSLKVHLLYVDGTTITSLATVTITTSTLTYTGTWACKLKPFKYLVCSGEQYCFVTLSDNVAKRVGIAQADIVDAATGVMYYRYKTSTIFSSLTAGSSYYVDDSWRATTESSSLSQRLGNALNATTILVE